MACYGSTNVYNQNRTRDQFAKWDAGYKFSGLPCNEIGKIYPTARRYPSNALVMDAFGPINLSILESWRYKPDVFEAMSLMYK